MAYSERWPERWVDAPFESTLAASGAVAAGFAFVAREFPLTLGRVLPMWVVFSWTSMLLIGSLAIGVGLCWTGRPLIGLALRRAGLILLGATFLVYAPAIFIFGLDEDLHSTWLIGTLVTGMGAACWWKSHLVGQDAKKIRVLSGPLEKEPREKKPW